MICHRFLQNLPLTITMTVVIGNQSHTFTGDCEDPEVNDDFDWTIGIWVVSI